MKKDKNMKNRIFVSNAILAVITIIVTSIVVYNVIKYNLNLYVQRAGMQSQIYAQTHDDIVVFISLIIAITLLIINIITNIIVKKIKLEYKSKKETITLETRLKKHQERIKFLGKLIEKEMLKTQYALDKMYEGIIILDTRKRIVQINKSAMELLEIEENHIFTGKNIIFAIKNNEILSQFDDALNDIKTSKTLKIQDRYLRTYVNPVIEEGEIQGIFCLIVDDTLLYEKEDERRRFTANITHELKTPLTSITGYAEIMSSMPVNQSEVKEFSEKIIKNTRNMKQMINNIIKISSLEDIGKVEKTNVNLDTVIENCIKTQEIQMQIKNIQIEKQIDKDTIINANENLIFDMVDNLLSNAIRYNKEGGKVEINLKNKEGKAVFTISDTGIGIPSKYKDKVFERFFVVDKSRSKSLGGSGLGLSIVKHIVKVHQASLSIETKENSGTKIEIAFERANRL